MLLCNAGDFCIVQEQRDLSYLRLYGSRFVRKQDTYPSIGDKIFDYVEIHVKHVLL
jgi:hypothetical protein